MTVFVNLPVRVMCRSCEKCPELDLTVELYYSDGEVVSSCISCRRVDACQRIYDMAEQDVIRFRKEYPGMLRDE